MRLLLVFAFFAVALQLPGQTIQVQRGVVVEPDTVRVGDPFRVVVRVRAPLGSDIEFPAGPDTSQKVEPLDPVAIAAGTDSSYNEQTATYRLAAWDIGRRMLRFPAVVVRSGNSERTVELAADLSVEVISVLPADSAQQVPKGTRDLFTFGPPWWLWLIVALVVAGIVALLWWWWHRRKTAQPEVLDPYQEAVRELSRIEGLGLLGAGESGQYVSLHAEVLRNYLSRVFPEARLSLTTTELVHALRGEGRAPVSRMQKLLHEVDLIKFAAQSLPASRAREVRSETIEVLESIEQALNPPQEQREAA